MSKRNTVYYSDIDAERLKEIFFSSPSKRHFPKKENLKKLKKPFFFSALAIVIFIFFYINHNYHLYLIPKIEAQTATRGKSLLKSPLSRIESTKKSDLFTKLKDGTVYLHLNIIPKIGLAIQLKHPLNLEDKTLILLIKRTAYPLKAKIILRDIYYISNVRNPLWVEIKSDQHFSRGEIKLSTENFNRLNLNKINQIRIYFQPHRRETSSGIFIKDIRVEKEGV